MRDRTLLTTEVAVNREDESFFRKFGERLASCRRSRGFTQVQLAEALGITQPRLLSFEKGRRRMPLSTLVRIAKALDVSTEELLGVQQQPSKRGPPSKLELQFERLSKLPRSKQRLVSDMLDGILLQQAS